MTTNTVIRARIDEHTKIQAAIVLDSIGLTLSDAYRLLLRHVVQEKRLPFSPLIPNKETLEAMKEAEKGNLRSFKNLKDLMADLHADD